MAKRSLPEIYETQLKTLEAKRETAVNRHVIPVEIKIEEVKEKLKAYYRRKGCV